MRYLLDADTVSFYLRRDPRVTPRLLAQVPEHLSLSSVTVMELEYGLERKPEKRASVEPGLIALLRDVAVLPYTESDARVTARLRAALARQGTPIGPYDIHVAGVAMARGLTLVTHNTREYARIVGLALEDWAVSV